MTDPPCVNTQSTAAGKNDAAGSNIYLVDMGMPRASGLGTGSNLTNGNSGVAVGGNGGMYAGATA